MEPERSGAERRAREWQQKVWDRLASVYVGQIEPRFAQVVEGVLRRADLRSGERVLDLGTGTGAVAIGASRLVGPEGCVTGVDISPPMLALAKRQATEAGATNVAFVSGRAENLGAAAGAFHVVLASLSLMYVVDRDAAARELRRVLRPGGRFVAAVWAGADRCDIVRFQETAGRFAPAPPVPGVGPGALADATSFLAQLGRAGIDVRVETEELGFEFESFDLAWDVLAGVTAAQLPPERQRAAREAVQAALWPRGEGGRRFRNATQFLVGRARA